jgi:hypothetical protein
MKEKMRHAKKTKKKLNNEINEEGKREELKWKSEGKKDKPTKERGDKWGVEDKEQSVRVQSASIFELFCYLQVQKNLSCPKLF